MPFPAALIAAAPYLASAAGGALTSYLGRGNQQQGGLAYGERPARTETMQRFDPQTLQALNQILGYGMSGLQQLQQPMSFAPIAQRAQTQFEQQTIPSIMSRFTNMGSGGGRSGAQFQLLGQAGAGLQEGLAAQEAQFGLQQRGQQQNWLSNLLQLGLQPRTEQFYIPRSPGFAESAVPAFAGGAGQGLGRALAYLLSQFGGGGTMGQDNTQAGGVR